MKARHAQCGATFSGRQEHCPACHETFNGGRAGDLHRVGDWTAETPRRCLTADEMRAAGMLQNSDWSWSRESRGQLLQDRPAASEISLPVTS